MSYWQKRMTQQHRTCWSLLLLTLVKPSFTQAYTFLQQFLLLHRINQGQQEKERLLRFYKKIAAVALPETKTRPVLRPRRVPSTNRTIQNRAEKSCNMSTFIGHASVHVSCLLSCWCDDNELSVRFLQTQWWKQRNNGLPCMAWCRILCNEEAVHPIPRLNWIVFYRGNNSFLSRVKLVLLILARKHLKSVQQQHL